MILRDKNGDPMIFIMDGEFIVGETPQSMHKRYPDLWKRLQDDGWDMEDVERQYREQNFGGLTKERYEEIKANEEGKKSSPTRTYISVPDGELYFHFPDDK